MDALGSLCVSGLIAKSGFEIGWGAVQVLTDRQSGANVERILHGIHAVRSQLEPLMTKPLIP